MKRLLLALLVWTCTAVGALAVNPNEVLPDPALEQRARDIGRDLRCLVCQNQSIDDSDADLARDLRVIVRQRLTAGDSDEKVMRYVVDRYGEYVLLRPPVNVRTYVLWFGPPLIFAGALAVVFAFYRRGPSAGEAILPLTVEEARQVERLSREHSET
ncbi:MAG: cytochrome c-type biogenesis protein CcmH [Alphaproteobacteria bacterium]